MEADGSWWVPRTSNPVCGASSVAGGFDSHALPPLFPIISIAYVTKKVLFSRQVHDKSHQEFMKI